MKPVWIMSCASLFAFGCSTSAPGPDKPAQSAAPTVSAPSINANVPEFVPGVGIGPVRIGMTRAEIDTLGMPVKPGTMGSEVSVGPYLASFDGDRVGAVFVTLRDVPSGVRVGGTVFEHTAKIEDIAQKLRGCGALQVNEGGNVIPCESGRAVVLAGGPPGIVALHAVSPERAARQGSNAGGAEGATWKHPQMAMSFSYPDKLLKVAHKPDGATLTSEILGTIEDRSDHGKDMPTPLTITISVRVGSLVDVMKQNLGTATDSMFPKGNEASFKEEKDAAERVTIAGAKGYRIQMGSHDSHAEHVYAEIKPRSTLEVRCSYVGVAKPKVSMAAQRAACERVISTLAIKL